MEPNMEALSQLLDKALGQATAAIHWDLARETLQAANGMPAVVGLQADIELTAPNGAPPAATPPAPNTPTAAAPPSLPAPNTPTAAAGSAITPAAARATPAATKL